MISLRNCYKAGRLRGSGALEGGRSCTTIRAEESIGNSLNTWIDISHSKLGNEHHRRVTSFTGGIVGILYPFRMTTNPRKPVRPVETDGFIGIASWSKNQGLFNGRMICVKIYTKGTYRHADLLS